MDFDKRNRKWMVDDDEGISIIAVNALHEVEHYSFTWDDVAIVPKDGSVGLFQRLYYYLDKNDSDYVNSYRIIILTGSLAESVNDLKKIIVDAAVKGG